MNGPGTQFMEFIRSLPEWAQTLLNWGAGVMLYLQGEYVGTSIGKAAYYLLNP